MSRGTPRAIFRGIFHEGQWRVKHFLPPKWTENAITVETSSVSPAPTAQAIYKIGNSLNSQKNLLRRAVQLPVQVRVPHDGLHVFSGFSKRNRFHQFLYITILAVTLPILHPVGAGIVSSQGVFEGAELIHHAAKITCAKLKIHAWRK